MGPYLIEEHMYVKTSYHSVVNTNSCGVDRGKLGSALSTNIDDTTESRLNEAIVSISDRLSQ